jgi:mannose-6-phosphate isomerase-like protein (cupin superfamily)
MAGAAETGGAFELIQETRTVEGGPAPHVHRERGEGFLVLEGRYRFVRGDEETELGEGAFLFVPRGTRHTFRTLAAPSRVLIVVAPAGLDAYFREMAQGLATGRAAPDIMLELSARYDTHPVA